MNSHQTKNGSFSLIENQEDQFSSNETLSNIPLINIDVGKVLAQKTQLLFPSYQVEQEFFTQGNIESAIDHFVLNLQSPLNKFDLNSTMIKMRSIVDEQEKKIQKSINTDNQYSHDDAFGFQSAMKYSFQSKFQNDDNTKNEEGLMDQVTNKNKLSSSSQLLNHAQSNTTLQLDQENEVFQTPLKVINQTNFIFNNTNDNNNKINNNIKFNGSAGPKQTTKEQQKVQTSKIKKGSSISKNKQKNENNFNQLQQNQENLNKNLYQNNIPTLHQFQSLTEQKEIYSNKEILHQNQHIKQPQNQSLQFSMYPQQQHEYNNNYINNQNENYNRMILMSAPPSIHYKDINQAQLKQQQAKGDFINNHHINFSLKPQNQDGIKYMNNNYQFQNQFIPNCVPHVQDTQTFSNLISSREQQYQNQIPHKIQELQYPQNQQKEQNQQTKENLVLQQTRINSLESVQQQLNFDLDDKEGDMNKSPFDNNQVEDNLLIKQNSNNINSFNCIDDFIEESRINCEEDVEIFKTNKTTFSPSLSQKPLKNQVGYLDNNINQDSNQFQTFYGQKDQLNNQQPKTNIKREEQYHNQELIYEQQYGKNQNLYDFLQYDSNSGLNLLIEDNNNFHANDCDFDKYME